MGDMCATEAMALAKEYRGGVEILEAQKRRLVSWIPPEDFIVAISQIQEIIQEMLNRELVTLQETKT